MVKTQMFARNSARNQRGLTLLELLITLSVLSFAMLIASNAIGAGSNRLAVEQAAERLISDLKKARLIAEKSGDNVALYGTEIGYEIPALSLSRDGGGKVAYNWSVKDREIRFSPRFAALGGKVVITKGERRAVIFVHPITGKIERVK